MWPYVRKIMRAEQTNHLIFLFSYWIEFYVAYFLLFQENLKKKQQLPSAPSSLSALRDTTTAQPTISHIPSSPITDLPTDVSIISLSIVLFSVFGVYGITVIYEISKQTALYYQWLCLIVDLFTYCISRNF